MIWVEVLAIIVVSLVILGLSVRALLVRLPRLDRAMRNLRRRKQEAEVLQMAVAHLRERVDATAEHAAAVQARLAEVREHAAAVRGR